MCSLLRHVWHILESFFLMLMMRFWTLFCILTPVICVVCKYFLSDFNCFKLIVSIVVQKCFSLIFVVYFCVFFLFWGVLFKRSLALQCPELFLPVVCFRSYIKIFNLLWVYFVTCEDWRTDPLTHSPYLR